MILTKHLYRLEEVRAAFLYCLKQCRMQEAFFWLEELEDSCYGGEARRLLFLSWLMRIGLRRLAWLDAWTTLSLTREGRQTLCCQLLGCEERDSSIWWLLWTVILPESYPLPEAPGQLFTEWHTHCKKSENDFWHHVLNISEDERIDMILSSLQDDMKSYTLFARAAGLTIAYGYKNAPKSSWVPIKTKPYTYEKASASEKDTLRFTRIYMIPNDCLYGMTSRGGGEDTTEELRRLGSDTFKQSPYWKTKWPSNSEDEQEEFWSTYFPCDHPDEWSAEQQGKSHGPGLRIGPLQRWWSNWIRSDRLFIWGSIHTCILKWIQTQQTPSTGSVFDILIEYYKTYTHTGSTSCTKKKEFILE